MKMKKLAALALAAVMTMGMATTALAQTQSATNPDADNASITIDNASKGETYAVYQLFDATVTGTADGSIAYQLMAGKTAPTDYFDVDASGNVSAKATTNEDVLKSGAFHTWAASYGTKVAEVESDGSVLTFTDLPYGYYYVTTTQGTNVTVDSTNPNVTIYDKNATTVSSLTKTVDDDDVYVGQTVTYTVSFVAANYQGAGATAEKIVSYTIEDTLPDFLTDVTVTSIIIDADGNSATTTDQTDVTAQFVNKAIELAWVDASGNSKYDNNSTVTLTYTAVVTDAAAIAGNGNTNTVTLTWVTDKDTQDTLTDNKTISTYAIALKKVDQAGNNLAGAQFSVAGITVKEVTTGVDGFYVVTAKGDTLNSGALKCDANGELVIKGVDSGDYVVTEEVAPNGYNKLTDTITITAVPTTATTTNTTTYLDENGNVSQEETTTTVVYQNNNLAANSIVVVNKTGTELPSTGGIGTTIFYVVGGILVLGAGVVLVAKKRMNHEA